MRDVRRVDTHAFDLAVSCVLAVMVTRKSTRREVRSQAAAGELLRSSSMKAYPLGMREAARVKQREATCYNGRRS